jgi:hypothetical protein
VTPLELLENQAASKIAREVATEVTGGSESVAWEIHRRIVLRREMGPILAIGPVGETPEEALRNILQMMPALDTGQNSGTYHAIIDRLGEAIVKLEARTHG